MTIAASSRGDANRPPQPASPKLGNFSVIFRALLGFPSEEFGEVTQSDVVTARSGPSSPFVTALTPPPPCQPSPVLYKDGLLGGLMLDADGPMSCPEVLSDDETTTLKPSGDSYLTPDPSTPSSSEERVKIRSTTTPAEPYDYFLLPVVSITGAVVGNIELSAGLPFHHLGGSRFFEFTPRAQVSKKKSLRPRYVSDHASKIALLHVRLHEQFNRDAATRRACGPTAMMPVHIFVDLSNIIIGFYDRLKLDRSIPLGEQVTPPPFFFEGFRRVLERGRPVARRVVAGSTNGGTERSKWPAYMVEAEECGFEMNILSRVTKITPKTRHRRGHRLHQGWTTSDHSSDDATAATQAKLGEQAVDEILHLKMCHSFLDHDPSTIVLATGDAAQAEFSDGFLKHVERALARGWCVELLAWRKNISAAWRALERNRLWTDRFQIIELDPFVDELFGAFLAGST